MNAIVVGYDDSAGSTRALQRAAQLAKALQASLVVTSVVPVEIPAAARSIGADPVQSPGGSLAELAAARSYLDAQGLPAEYVEASGHPAESILAAAQEHSADMIVVGMSASGLLARLFGGSVSETVSQRAPCDVLIVH